MSLGKELRVGDEFVYRGRRLRVVGRPRAGRYSFTDVPVIPTIADTISLDYNEEVAVLNRPSADHSSEHPGSPVAAADPARADPKEDR